MQVEEYNNGVNVPGHAFVIRKVSGVNLSSLKAVEEVRSGSCPKCGKSGFSCCKYGDKQEISNESRELYQSLKQNDVKKAQDKYYLQNESTKTDKSESNSEKEKLSEAERQEIRELEKRDREVRQHEQAHLAAAGGIAVSGANYQYETGPDGKRYAVGGEVNIALKKGSTPEETLRNAEQASRAALAPANPSSQDRKVATEAKAEANKARSEISQKGNKEKEDQSDKDVSQIQNEEISKAGLLSDEVINDKVNGLNFRISQTYKNHSSNFANYTRYQNADMNSSTGQRASIQLFA